MKPEYPGVSDELFAGVKKNYKEVVLIAVSNLDEDHKDVHKLDKLMRPQLQTVLARQRRDYGIDEESYEMDYPVFEQSMNIDETPVHNIGMERQCGKVDYRLKKFGTLPSVSRSIILQKSQQLREGINPTFRGFKKVARRQKRNSAKVDGKYTRKI